MLLEAASWSIFSPIWRNVEGFKRSVQCSCRALDRYFWGNHEISGLYQSCRGRNTRYGNALTNFLCEWSEGINSVKVFHKVVGLEVRVSTINNSIECKSCVFQRNLNVSSMVKPNTPPFRWSDWENALRTVVHVEPVNIEVMRRVLHKIST